MKKITLITSSELLSHCKHEHVGILIESASDSHFSTMFTRATPIMDLIGHPDERRQFAGQLTAKLLSDEPRLRGIPQLTVFQEQLSWELQKIFCLLHVYDYLINHNFNLCELTSPSWWGNGLMRLSKLKPSQCTIKIPCIKQHHRLKNALNRVMASGLSLNTIYDEFHHGLDYLDPFHFRSQWMNPFKHERHDKHKLWYYTTAITFTNIGLSYEKFFPEPFHFLVEDKLTGGKPLYHQHRSFAYLYDFLNTSFIPKKDEIIDSAEHIQQHLLRVQLDEKENLARQLLMESGLMNQFFSRVLPQGLFSSSLFGEWIEKTEPKAVIVGNPVFEGYALYQARARKIPTILLQHGILGEYDFYAEYPVDYYLLRGQFWYERISPHARKNALIMSPRDEAKSIAIQKSNVIILITTPLHLRYISIDVDFKSIFETLLHTVAEIGMQLIIRVHPMEKISTYKKQVKALSRDASHQRAITYSQYDPLDPLLKKAAAAVMFGSTVFMDCIRLNVPIISFAWYDFAIKNKISQYQIFNFAKDLADFKNLIHQASRRELQIHTKDAHFILHDTSDDVMKQHINKLLNHQVHPIESEGRDMHDLAKRLYPICRSITGEGVRQTLRILQTYLPDIKMYEVSSGTTCFDWVVPDEWNIRDAYILTPDGHKIADFQKSNLHVLNYSIPVNTTMELDELNKYLYSLPELPDAIPYMTSYYEKRFGFCISHRERQSLKPGKYQVVIDSTLKPGSLTYGELVIQGALRKEILLSTYICHPSMGNNELSGPIVTTFLALWLKSFKPKYTYRIVFVPETIGSITYLSLHHQELKKNVHAGFNISCVGDERTYSYLPSRLGDTIADRVAKHVLKHIYPSYQHYSFRDRGSDERQYCSPHIDLPIASIMRSKYGTYPEYHTSLDDLDFITPKGLYDGYQAIQYALQCLEQNQILQTTCFCEPQLGKRGLYPTLGQRKNEKNIKNMMDILAYCDGKHDLLHIAELINVPLWDMMESVRLLQSHELLVPTEFEISSSENLIAC